MGHIGQAVEKTELKVGLEPGKMTANRLEGCSEHEIEATLTVLRGMPTFEFYVQQAEIKHNVDRQAAEREALGSILRLRPESSGPQGLRGILRCYDKKMPREDGAEIAALVEAAGDHLDDAVREYIDKQAEKQGEWLTQWADYARYLMELDESGERDHEAANAAAARVIVASIAARELGSLTNEKYREIKVEVEQEWTSGKE